MPKNEFKPFAIGDQANVLKQEDYEQLPAIMDGFQSGIARSEELNKVWRQASTIASVVASFMAEQSNKDVLDNGDVGTLHDTLLEALLHNSTSQLDDRYLKIESALSDLKDAESARDNLGLGELAVKDGLTAADVGALTQSDGDKRYVNITGDIMTGGLTTPNLAAGTVRATDGVVAINAVFQNNNQYSRLYFFDAGGEGLLAYLEADFSKNLVLNANGGRFVMDRNGNFLAPVGVYDASGRTYSPGNPSSKGSLGNSGWERNLDTGLIRQWGSYVSGSTNTETRGFPIAFPNTAVGVYANIGVGGNGNVYVEQSGNTYFNSRTTATGVGVYWTALGY